MKSFKIFIGSEWLLNILFKYFISFKNDKIPFLIILLKIAKNNFIKNY